MKKKVKIKIEGIQHYSTLTNMYESEESSPDNKDDDIFVEEEHIDIKNIEVDYGKEGLFSQKGIPSDGESPGIVNNNYELTTTGDMTEDENGISIEYEESEITGMKGSKTKLVILKNGCVTISRTGSVTSHLVFEKGKRHICTDSEEILPFWVCIATNNIKNTMDKNGGGLDIDYFIEISGERAEHNEIKMTIF